MQIKDRHGRKEKADTNFDTKRGNMILKSQRFFQSKTRKEKRKEKDSRKFYKSLFPVVFYSIFHSSSTV